MKIIDEAQAMATYAYQSISMLHAQTLVASPERINTIAETYSVFFGSVLSLDNNNQRQDAYETDRMNFMLGKRKRETGEIAKNIY